MLSFFVYTCSNSLHMPVEKLPHLRHFLPKNQADISVSGNSKTPVSCALLHVRPGARNGKLVCGLCLSLVQCPMQWSAKPTYSGLQGSYGQPQSLRLVILTHYSYKVGGNFILRVQLDGFS